MTFRIFTATAAAIGLLASAGAASALTITYPTALGDATTLPAGQTLVVDFNSDIVDNTDNPYLYPTLLAGYTMTLNGATVGYQEGQTGYSGNLPENPVTTYLTVIPNGSATLQALSGFKAFSFYMGSPDTYNSIQIFKDANLLHTVSGTTLVDGDTNQNWGFGQRINVNLDGQVANKIVFTSTEFSFELDNIAVAAVPEPATWGLMIGGFGMAGAMLRRRRTALA